MTEKTEWSNESPTPEVETDLETIIDDLLSLENDGDNRVNTLWHVVEMVTEGEVDEASARQALLDKGFTREEIDDEFDETPWEEIMDEE